MIFTSVSHFFYTSITVLLLVGTEGAPSSLVNGSRRHTRPLSRLSQPLHSLCPWHVAIGWRSVRGIGRMFQATFARARPIDQMFNDLLRRLLRCQAG